WLHELEADDLPALYSGASVFCLPSHYEGFGIPPLEAMACGTPVVVSDRASLPEVVGEAGEYVNPDDPESIAHGLQRVLSDTDLVERMRTEGFKQASRFSWTENAMRTLAIYEQVLAL
nr:glycosyltransferase family 4 protein [Anaerolineae bacterium]